MENPFVFNEYNDLIGKRILVAEDNLLNQIIIRKILEKWQVIIEIVENGEEAIIKFSEQNFDIVLMDIQMPVMDGYAASKKIRLIENINAQKVPIIALTASVNYELQKMIESAGMDAFLLKPYSPESLHEMLITHIK